MSFTQGPSFEADDTLAAFVFVEAGLPGSNSNFLMGLADTVSSVILGITQDGVNSGSSAEVAQLGQARLQLGESVTAGDLVGPQTATGLGTTFLPLTTTSMNARAIALQSGSTNSVIKVNLI